MKITDYINNCSNNAKHVSRLSRVIDIYHDVFLEYSEGLGKPTSNISAPIEDVILCFKYLSGHIDNPKVLNTELKLIDLLTARGGAYLQSEEYHEISNIIEEKLLLI